MYWIVHFLTHRRALYINYLLKRVLKTIYLGKRRITWITVLIVGKINKHLLLFCPDLCMRWWQLTGGIIIVRGFHCLKIWMKEIEIRERKEVYSSLLNQKLIFCLENMNAFCWLRKKFPFDGNFRLCVFMVSCVHKILIRYTIYLITDD